jgi:hypothetical protein
MSELCDGHERPQLSQLHSPSLSEGFIHFIGRIRLAGVDSRMNTARAR